MPKQFKWNRPLRFSAPLVKALGSAPVASAMIRGVNVRQWSGVERRAVSRRFSRLNRNRTDGTAGASQASRRVASRRAAY